ncbi:MAG: WD40 repeat domain-containing protein [Planctomycetaceae bacterium]
MQPARWIQGVQKRGGGRRSAGGGDVSMRRPSSRMRRSAAACLLMLAAVPRAVAAVPAYDHDIAPILRTYCSGCHNDRERESGFSVERYAALRRGGDGSGDPLVAGEAAAPVLLERIRSTAVDHMPPPNQPQVPAADLAVLEAWIAAGAPGPATDSSILETLVVPRRAAYPGRMPVTAAAASADGTRVAVARGRAVEIVGLRNGRPAQQPLVVLADLPGTVSGLHFSSDGSRLVVASGIAGLRGVAEIRDATTGVRLGSFAGHRDLLADAELSPDESTLATAGYDRSIKLWNVSDGTLVRSIDVHNGPVSDLAWHPSGRLLASASGDETVKLWRRSDGARLDTLSQPQGGLASVAFTPDGGQVVAAGRDRRIHLWKLVSLDTPAINPPVHARFAHETPIVALALSADGRRLVTTAEDRSLKSWSVPDLTLERDCPRQPDVVAAVAGLPDGRYVVGRMDGSLDLIDAGRPPVAASPGPATEDLHHVSATEAAVVTEAAVAPVASVAEAEPNDAAGSAHPVPTPSLVSGTIQHRGDTDCFRFTAEQNVPLIVEVLAASGSPPSKLDSRLEILDAAGVPVEQVVLQAVRDSWFTFLGKNSTQSDDFRLHNADEMELDDYVYAGGEVVRLWLYPRGPDSGFMVYPGSGDRHTFFTTSAVVHALGEPAWVVEPLPRGAAPVPNGLPVFRLAYENDDDPARRLGTDSQILFVPPQAGEYVARVSDVRGFGDAADYHYVFGVRPPRPSFAVRVEGTSPRVSPGGGREVSFFVTRSEGFVGPVRIEVDGLPAGFTFHGPVEIEAGQQRARGVLSASADAVLPDEAADAAVRVRAVASIGGREVVQDLGTLGDLSLGDPPRFTTSIVAGSRGTGGDAGGAGSRGLDLPQVTLTVRPGETITARVRVERRDFAEEISFGVNEAVDRNLPHGVIIDDLGLNGLLIIEGASERDFSIRATPRAAPGRRLFHLLATPDGGQASPPVWLEVVPAAP